MSVLASARAQREEILVIDDDEAVLRVVDDILTRSGYRVVTTASANEAIELIDQRAFGLVVSDISMPEMSGLALIEAVELVRPGVPILLCSGHGDNANLTDALNRGAAGFIAKPFRPSELRQRVRTVLNRSLINETNLRERFLAPTVATALANAVEVRDATMEGHTDRLSGLALAIGRERGLSDEQLEILKMGAVLHDIGKIGIPDDILLRPGPIAAEERAVMQMHTVIGDQMLIPLGLLESIRPIVRHHHERWDGTGYPDQLCGEEIPLLARIVSVADSIEAMCGNRPYREPLDGAGVMRELHKERGRQWDPDLVDAALDLIESGRVRFERSGMQVLPSMQHGHRV
jgi:putative two-component system response regulator